VIEAYMHGVPVIASNRGGLPEIVDHGRTGLLYDAADAANLADAINQFLRDRSMLTRMKPWIAEKAKYFVWGRMRSEYLDVLEQARDLANTSAAKVPAIT